MSKVVRLRSWKDFKRLAIKLKPDSITYCIDQNGMSKTKDPTCLRLILTAPNAYYVYIDFPKMNTLRDTEIPIHENKQGRFLDDQEIKEFLRNQLGRKDLAVFSYWTT